MATSHAGDFLAVGMESGKVELNTLPDCVFEDFLVRWESRGVVPARLRAHPLGVDGLR